MNSPTVNNLCLKESSGWFVAGTSFCRALRTLSDGAFKLFTYLCLEADRRTGRFEIGQKELAKAIGKSRRIVGKYIEELECKGICTVRSGRNQHARTCFEIRDEYWPYHRTQEVESADDPVVNPYVDAIKRHFVSIGCTSRKFNNRDVQFAEDLQRRGVALDTVRDAMLIGAVRKYVSWLNGSSLQPIGSLAYFAALVSEISKRSIPADYRNYLQKKFAELERAWAKKSTQTPQNEGCLDMPRSEIVQ